jgi:hypothetical protein
MPTPSLGRQLRRAFAPSSADTIRSRVSSVGRASPDGRVGRAVIVRELLHRDRLRHPHPQKRSTDLSNTPVGQQSGDEVLAAAIGVIQQRVVADARDRVRARAVSRPAIALILRLALTLASASATIRSSAAPSSSPIAGRMPRRTRVRGCLCGVHRGAGIRPLARPQSSVPRIETSDYFEDLGCVWLTLTFIGSPSVQTSSVVGVVMPWIHTRCRACGN